MIVAQTPATDVVVGPSNARIVRSPWTGYTSAGSADEIPLSFGVIRDELVLPHPTKPNHVVGVVADVHATAFCGENRVQQVGGARVQRDRQVHQGECCLCCGNVAFRYFTERTIRFRSGGGRGKWPIKKGLAKIRSFRVGHIPTSDKMRYEFFNCRFRTIFRKGQHF